MSRFERYSNGPGIRDDESPLQPRRYPRSFSLGTGHCRVCGYAPVAYDAFACPQCGARRPNPGVLNRYINRGVVVGLGVFWLLGAVFGFFAFNFSPWIALGMMVLGTLPGTLFGLLGGMIAGCVANATGKR
jgi:hypothetical protein